MRDGPPPKESRRSSDLFAALGKMFAALVRHGYRPADLWAMTPRQINAALTLSEQDYRLRLADSLGVNAVAAQGDGKAIEKQIKALSK